MLLVAQTRELDMRDILKHSIGPLLWSLATSAIWGRPTNQPWLKICSGMQFPFITSLLHCSVLLMELLWYTGSKLIRSHWAKCPHLSSIKLFDKILVISAWISSSTINRQSKKCGKTFRQHRHFRIQEHHTETEHCPVAKIPLMFAQQVEPQPVSRASIDRHRMNADSYWATQS